MTIRSMPSLLFPRIMDLDCVLYGILMISYLVLHNAPHYCFLWFPCNVCDNIKFAIKYAIKPLKPKYKLMGSITSDPSQNYDALGAKIYKNTMQLSMPHKV